MIAELNRRPFLISDARARQELRYHPVITRQQGIERLRDAVSAPSSRADHSVLPLTSPASSLRKLGRGAGGRGERGQATIGSGTTRPR